MKRVLLTLIMMTIVSSLYGQKHRFPVEGRYGFIVADNTNTCMVIDPSGNIKNKAMNPFWGWIIFNNNERKIIFDDIVCTYNPNNRLLSTLGSNYDAYTGYTQVGGKTISISLYTNGEALTIGFEINGTIAFTNIKCYGSNQIDTFAAKTDLIDAVNRGLSSLSNVMPPSSSSYSSSTRSNSNTKDRLKCHYCNGTGEKIIDPSETAPNFGTTNNAQEYCAKCGRYFRKGSHAHITCGHCGGKGYIEY